MVAITEILEFYFKSKNNKKKILVSYNSIFDKNLPKLRKNGWITIHNIDKKNEIRYWNQNGIEFTIEEVPPQLKPGIYCFSFLKGRLSII